MRKIIRYSPILLFVALAFLAGLSRALDPKPEHFSPSCNPKGWVISENGNECVDWSWRRASK